MPTKILLKLALALVALYKLVLSPLLGPRCRFLPSCSDYAAEAMRKHGPGRGGALALKRLCHCHPIKALGGGSGFDPVPEKAITATDQKSSTARLSISPSKNAGLQA